MAKVGGKIFAFLGGGRRSALKCGRDADEAAELRHRYPEHATVMAYIGRLRLEHASASDGTVPDDELLELVDASYDAVVAKLPKKLRPLSATPANAAQRSRAGPAASPLRAGSPARSAKFSRANPAPPARPKPLPGVEGDPCALEETGRPDRRPGQRPAAPARPGRWPPAGSEPTAGSCSATSAAEQLPVGAQPASSSRRATPRRRGTRPSWAITPSCPVA